MTGRVRRERAGLRTGIHPEIRTLLRDAGPRLGAARHVSPLRCATVDVGCMAVPVLVLGQRKAWRDRGAHVGSTDGIPLRREQSKSALATLLDKVGNC
jgi:hypothetical protein